MNLNKRLSATRPILLLRPSFFNFTVKIPKKKFDFEKFRDQRSRDAQKRRAEKKTEGYFGNNEDR